MSKAVINELKKRLEEAERRAAAPKFSIEDYCFSEQIEFIRDANKFKTAVCSRRAGKTISCAADLIDTALTKDGDVAYITLTRGTAKRIIWRELNNINVKYQLGAKVDNQELTLTMPNGNIIYLSGAKDESEIEKFRGMALRKIYIDEAQSFRPYIKELIDDVLEPALTDYDGSLILIGTPGPVPAGYFYEASSGDGWSHHSWTIHSNPHIKIKSGKSAEEIIAERCKRRGVTVADPSIRREYFGEWIQDYNSLVYKFDPKRNIYSQLPDKLRYIFGIDIGWKDADAIAVVGYDDRAGKAYLIHEDVADKQDITTLAEKIKVLQAKYEPVKMVMDAGALGKKIQDEIRVRHGLPVEAAEKVRKLEFISLLNDDLRNSHFQAFLGSRFAEDSQLVVWDWEDPSKPKISDRYHSDSCFIAGTIINTGRGLIPIEHVCPGDTVLTRLGYFPVKDCGGTQRQANVIQLTFSDGNTITCTPGHRFFTKKRGFVEATRLTYQDEIVNLELWEKTKENTFLGKLSFLTAQNFTGTPNQKEPTLKTTTAGIGETRDISYTGQFGNFIMDLFLKTISYIIKIQTPLTTPYLISHACHENSTLENTNIANLLKKVNCTWKKLDLWPQSGMEVQKDLFGTDNTLKIGKNKIDKKIKQFAQYATKTTLETAWLLEQNIYAAQNVILKTAELLKSIMKIEAAPAAQNPSALTSTQNNKPAVFLVRRSSKMPKDVYNLTIDGPREYFANNILVHNCDAVLYAWRECKHYFKLGIPVKHSSLSDPYMAELEAKEAQEVEDARLGHSQDWGVDSNDLGSLYGDDGGDGGEEWS